MKVKILLFFLLIGIPIFINGQNTPVFPAPCPAGTSIYTVRHNADFVNGTLPGGFCVTTELSLDGVTPSVANASVLNGSFVNTPNIIADGGAFSFLTTDGDATDVRYTFCEPVTNPFLFVGPTGPEVGTVLAIFEADGVTPINVTEIDGQAGFTVQNGNEITATTNNQSGYVQIQDNMARTTFVVAITNAAGGGADGFDLGVGVCMPDPVTPAISTCPFDLHYWTKDNACSDVYKDAQNNFFERNNNGSLGDFLFNTTPLCGTTSLFKANAIDDPDCRETFTCDVAPVRVDFSEPDGNGNMYLQGWVNNSSVFEGPGNIQGPFTDAFSATDANGLPAHGITTTPDFQGLRDVMGAGLKDDDLINAEFNVGNDADQYVLDGWVAVPPDLPCVSFFLGNSNRAQSSALYAGTGFNDLAFLASEINGTLTPAVYVIPNTVSTFGCGWQWVRIRVYHHDEFAFSDTRLGWDVGNGRETIPANYVHAATSPTDNTPPANVDQMTVSTRYGLVDENGTVWVANGKNAPTSTIDLCANLAQCADIVDIDDCTGQPAPTSGQDCATVFAANPCHIDIDEIGCVCDDPANTFPPSRKPSEVTGFAQTLAVSSCLDNAYTISNVVGLSSPPVLNTTNTNPDIVIYNYTATSGVAYSFDVTGTTSNVTVTQVGECAPPDECNCPLKPEICGDNIDNDCDGAIDGADADILGNCELDCNATPIEIQGKVLVTDGLSLTQIWSRRTTTGAFCCTARADRQQSAVGVSGTTGGVATNGALPALIPFTTPLATGTSYNVGTLPAHVNGPATGVDGVQQLRSFGVIETAIPSLTSRGRGDQFQADAWIVLPAGLHCMDVRVNNPSAHDASTLFLGPSINDMDHVGGSWGLIGNYTNDLVVDGSQTQASINFTYDALADGVVPVTPDPSCPNCSYCVVRARWYGSDVSIWSNAPVQWNIGNGWENIPREYIQSVGPTAADADTDNNKPNMLRDLAPYCAYRDTDGDLFSQNGNFFALDPTRCERIVNSECLTCPDNLFACEFEEENCLDPAVDANNTVIQQSPECFFKVVRVTPRTFTPVAGNGLTTTYWDHDVANCVDNTIANESVFCAFNGFDDDPATCPNCLPQHPNPAGATGIVVLPTLGVNGAALPNDADADNFLIGAINRISGENAQQDGWLAIPPEVECISFRISSVAWDAGALYLGPNINNMTLVGDNVNRVGENPVDTFFYDVPANTPEIACDGCGDLPVRLLRVRTYHHDNNMFANTVWEWDIGNNFAIVPQSNLFPLVDQCSNDLPAACPTVTEGTPFLAVKDANNRYFDYADMAAKMPANADFVGAGILVNRVFVTDGCNKIDPVCEPFETNPDEEVCNTTDLSALDTEGICTACPKIELPRTLVTGCSGTFTDDGSNDGNYDDAVGAELFTYCPDNPAKQSISFSFTEFDIASGDTFRIFTGSDNFTNDFVEITGNSIGQQLGRVSGHGNEPLFGAGWASSACNSVDGCLTVYWSPNGDNRKGSGWSFNVTCEDRAPELGECTVGDYFASCLVGTAMVNNVPLPTISDVCEGNVLYYVEYSVDLGEPVRVPITLTTIPTLGNLTLGSHLLNVRLVYVGEDGISCSGDDIVCEERNCVFSVRSSSLPVCNDEVNIALGSACVATITPDDLLENPDMVTNAFQILIENLGGDPKETAAVENNNTANPTILVAGLYKYTITDACGQTCSGQINLFDNSPPLFNGTTRDTIVNCNVDLTAAGLGVTAPTAFDNCGEATVNFAGAVYIVDGGVCETSIVEITWEAVDVNNNTSTLNQTVVIERPDITKFVALEDVTINCEEAGSLADDLTITGIPGLQVGRIVNGVFSPTDTIDLSLTEYVCGYILTKSDVTVGGSDCGDKVFRTWELLDWCAPEGSFGLKDVQGIFFKDTEAPIFQGESADMELPARTIALDHFDCTYDITKLELPLAIDNCDATPTVRLDRVARIEDGNTDWEIEQADWTALDVDSFELRWIVEDECHEQLEHDTTFQVVVIADETLPSAVVTDQINLSIPDEYGAALHVEDIDGGSFDACGIKSKEIRIRGANQPWDSIVTIGCAYLHPDAQVELRVIDNNGNEATAWLNILVEDKINPYCKIEDQDVFCDEFHQEEFGTETDANGDKKMDDSEYVSLEGDLLVWYNTNFGTPNCEDNLRTTAGCGVLVIEQEYQYLAKPCGEGMVLRRARATDWSGNVSDWTVQTITINYRADWKVTFPNDWTGGCGDVIPEPSVLVENGTCDLLASEVTEKRFDVPGDVCYMIERTYHIINWCRYEAGDAGERIARVEGLHNFAEGPMVTSEGNEDLGYFTYVQILKVRDNEAPVVTIQNPEPCINGLEFDAEPYGEEDQSFGTAPFECDELKTWTATATDCVDESEITWVGKLFDLNGNLVKEVATNMITHTVTNKTIFFAEFYAFDACGNSGDAKSDPVKFWDCKQPTPYAINGLAIALMESGMVQIWATDLDQASFDNCTDQDKLEFFIWHQSIGDAPTDLAGVLALPKVIDFTCKELGNQTVNLYVVDEEENWDFVSTSVLIQDNGNICTNTEPTGMVAGMIIDANEQLVEGVEVAVNGNSTTTMTTTENGNYQFGLPMNGDYTITPKKDINPLNGVSTFDLVLISKHILGISKFDTPYKYIAADINKSGTVTAFDMVQLRQVILNITSEFTQNDSWRFVTAGQVFTTENPASESFDEFLNINNLAQTMEGMDFIAIKIGDVNGNAATNNLVQSEARSKGEPFTLEVAEQLIQTGQTVKVAFTASDLATIEGYQFTLNFDGLTFVDLTEGIAKADNFNTLLAERGRLTTSWNGDATNDEELFQLTFIANKTGLLSELLSISSQTTQAEAYNSQGELLDIALNFTDGTVNEFGLFQNSPNPFKQETVIGFNLPNAALATLTIMDIQGRILTSIEQNFAKGYNQVNLNAKELGATGVIYYQLSSANHIAVKKMIILE